MSAANEEPRPFQIGPIQAHDLLAMVPFLEVAKSCNLDRRDRLAVGRVGQPGTGIAARGLVEVHEGGRRSRVYLAAPELRQIASALLNVADAIDGVTPLAFFNPDSPSAADPHDPTNEGDTPK